MYYLLSKWVKGILYTCCNMLLNKGRPQASAAASRLVIIYLHLKKIRVIRHVKQIIWKETYKSLDFWKIHSQNPVSIWFKNTYFQGKKFFQMVLKNFLSVVWQCLIYLEGCLRPYLYSRKKIGVIRHIDQKILTKNRFAFKKKLIWNYFPLYHCKYRGTKLML